MINAKDWKAKGHYWTWKNHQIFTVEKGEGPVLLLIHGFPTSSWDWAKIWPELTKKFRVIAHDMMGFGWTDKPKDFPYSIHAQADMLEDYLKVHNIESVHILAHDYGDTVAQEMWSRHLEGKAGFPDIQSVVLLNGGIFPETHHAILLQKLLLSPIGKWVNRLTNQKRFDKNFSSVFGQDSKPSREELDTFWEIINYQDGHLLAYKHINYMAERRQYRSRWVGILEKTEVPYCLINGPEDPVSGLHMTEHYKNIVGRAEVYLLPGIGHYPQTEDPEGVLKYFWAFHETLS